jgi:plastocyanin
LENDFNDGNKVLNGYDPLTPGIKMTEARKKQIADDTTKYGLHEPTVTTFKSIPPPPVVPAAKTVSVFIENNKFNPADAVINKGDTIVWLNKDKATHVIASDPHPAHTDLPALVSGNIEEGKTFSFKFDTAGKFGYHDHLKPATKGTVEVK